MKNIFLSVVFFFCLLQVLHSQEGGVASFNIPVRNSLKFNKFIINPAFSFAREQNSYISIFNKREWVQFEDAPQTYLISYSGRFRENQGISVGLFQQNYGVLTTFGGIANFAQNVYLGQDSNLTFGVNLGFYKSGINTGKVVTNYPDPSLETIPSNSLITLSPGINYGTAFFDFGFAINNAVLYNLQSSEMVQDDPERSIQAHIMYTGFIDSYGFFDKSKFSGLVRAESKKEQTIVSGLMMFSIPKGIWAQAGYNSFHGVSAGIGLNLTSRIALEYNYEKALGSFTQFGPSHEIVLAYKFKGSYSDDDEEEGAIIPALESRKVTPSKPVVQAKVKSDADIQKENELNAAKAKVLADAKATSDAIAQTRLESAARAKALLEANRLKREKIAADAAAKAKAIADAKTATVAKPVVPKTQPVVITDAKAKADAKAKLEAQAAKLAADAKVKADADAKAKLAADAKAKLDAQAAKLAADADARAKLASDAKVKLDAEAAKLAADAKAKADADTKAKLDTEAAKLAADAKAKADADARAKLASDAKAKLEAQAAKLAADAKAKADADAKAKLAADARAKLDAEAAKLDADAKAKADAEAKLDAETVKLAADAKAKADADAKAKLDAEAAKLAADAKAKADADARAKLTADAKAKLDAEAAKLAADAKAKADADARAKLAADSKAKSDAEAAKLAADAKAKADADARAKLAADAKAKQDAETAKLAADAKAKADADAKLASDAKAKLDAETAKLAADAKAKADADARAKLAADAKAKLDAETAKLAADAKAKADAEAKLAADAKAKLDAENAKLAADVKAKADADARAKANAKPKDENAKTMDNIAETLDNARKAQLQLLNQLNEKVNQREKELKDLKTENDLSDKGIASAPKEFKSVSAENNALESLKSEIDQVNKSQNQLLSTFKNLYEERIKKVPNKNDALTQSYLKTIDLLKGEQLKAEQSNTNLITSLEKIKIETEIEKKRRIKKANFENEDSRYQKDQETLKRIKETTTVSTVKLKPEDFDYGNEQSNMQIIKNIKNVETGYYLVLAVHADVAKRDSFVTKTIAAGESKINFFYDVKSTNYFIYSEKFDNLQEATRTLESRGNKPYNGKMVMVRVEN
ncbi:PorP/SprF family type IX secretion system membrane protein [Flavobacterium sinopsychrotolerans]|uniref:Type IX secretion system membrane protein, PorP/SprF family n=1 Tax=Flavobacterium sinopsychrotolerans TaxID=604089 RepID=A0A1H8JQT4_9FLAO|nr:type IX secretion system membrane protein PorP/SprF [Flavobacterium sinopsychrotolerans]SEN83110.1 type IX secretion system membrane protein, PorP/SprF family [Flavobacterium sinopsychrotolerans]